MTDPNETPAHETPPTSPEGAPPEQGLPESSSDDRTMAMLCHLLGIFTWVIGALIIWLIKKDQSTFVNDQGREAVNFQITIGFVWLVSGLIIWIPPIGCLVVPVVWIVNLVFCLMGAVAANRGERYRYPIAVRLIS